MAKKRKKKTAKRRARRNPRGISKRQYARLLAQVRRMKKNPKRRRKAKKAKRRNPSRVRTLKSGKLGRWYKGPRGVKVRMVNRGGKRVVELRSR